MLKSLYGTRDAAVNWQNEVKKQMKGWGFKQGEYNPCLYVHEKLGLKTMVHGDDFVTVGFKEDVEKFNKMLKERFEVKTKMIGEGEGMVQEERILNRVVRITEGGWELEADQRHGEMVIEELGLKEAKEACTPGEQEKEHEKEVSQELLDPMKSTKFRRLAARLNYLAQDRPDIMFSVKDLCRQMANPSVGGWKRLKRVARYLIGGPRLIMKY